MALSVTNLTWFLAQLKPNSVRIANANLIRQGFQTFLPMEKITRQCNGKLTTELRPLFPGYIFVSFDASLGLWRTVNPTQGITRLISFGKEPAPVPLDLVNELMMRGATAWIQTSSATVDLKAAISSAMASAGVLHPRVFLGRLFIRFAMSLSHVWLASFRSVPLGMN